MSRLGKLISSPDTVVQRIVDTCVEECPACKESVTHIRETYPKATLLWAGLCEEHLPWARAFTDRPDGRWPGFLPWIRKELERLDGRILDIQRAIESQERIENGLAFIRKESLDGERLLRALARIEELQKCKHIDDCELDMEALEYKLTEYDFMREEWRVQLTRATRALPA